MKENALTLLFFLVGFRDKGKKTRKEKKVKVCHPISLLEKVKHFIIWISTNTG